MTWAGQDERAHCSSVQVERQSWEATQNLKPSPGVQLWREKRMPTSAASSEDGMDDMVDTYLRRETEIYCELLLY